MFRTSLILQRRIIGTAGKQEGQAELDEQNDEISRLAAEIWIQGLFEESK